MNQHLLKKLRKKSKKNIYVSALTVAELEFGVSNSQYPVKNRLALMKFLSVFDILPFDENDAIIFKKDVYERDRQV